MKKPLFTGACTALVTPFLNGEVNYPMLQRLIQRQINAGIEAIVLCGTTGEASTLTDSEKLKLSLKKQRNTQKITVLSLREPAATARPMPLR